MSPNLINWLLLLCLIFLWGTSFMVTAIAVETVSPMGIVALRVVSGALVLLGAMRLKGLKLPRDRVAWAVFLVMGLMGNLFPFFLIGWGQQWISSGMAGVIMAVMPLVTMVLAHYLVDGEDLNRYKLIGFAVGLSGIMLLLGPVFGGASREILGAIAVFIAASFYAVNTILARRLPSYTPLITGAGVLVAGSLVAIPLWLLESGLWQLLPGLTPDSHFVAPTFSDASLLAVIWLGIGPTGIATIIYFLVIQRAGPTFLSTINYLIPVVAFFSGALFLAEEITAQSLLALIIVLAGIALTRYRS